MTVIRDLVRETEAARVLRENLADLIGDDFEFACEVVESETDLNEAIELAVKQEGEDAASVDAIDEYITVLKSRKDRIKKRIDSTRTAIAIAMEQAGQKRIDTPFGTVTRKKTVQTAIVTDETSIPSYYWKPQDPKLDKSKLAADLRDGQSISGATLSNGGETIVIKRS